MIYRFAICDDESKEIEYLKQLVQQWANKHSYSTSIDTFPSAEAFLFQYAEDKSYDILLLDIEMANMNGVQLAKTIRAENKEVQIIFITGFLEYISDGYDVDALHYLLKPISEEKFFSVLDRAVEKLKRNERILILDLGDESVRIPLYEIQYLEVQRNYVTVHGKNEYTIKSSLSELEKELDNMFFRVGRSFIVNLRYVRRITKTDVFLSNGSSIPLPRGLYKTINRAMIECL